MMKKIFQLNANWVTRRPGWVLICVLVLTVIAGFFASQLSMELNWVSLAPDNSAAVQEYHEIIEEFPSLDSIIVLIESDDYTLLQQATHAAAERVSQLDEYVSSVVAGVEQDYMLENAMMFMSDDEMQMMGYVFQDANISSLYQFLYMLLDQTTENIDELSDEEILYNAAMILSMQELIQASHTALDGELDQHDIASAIKSMFAGSGILTSPDGRMAMMTIQPSFDMMDEVMLIPGVDAIEAALEEVNAQFPDVMVRGTGMHYVARDELVSVMNDSYVATILSILLILAVLYFAFRIWVAPIFTVAPLLFGIAWSMGVVGLFVGRLNMLTVFAVAMLLGLGIDYAIHLYSSYTQRRAAGDEKSAALTYAITHTGPSIVVGALTTAAAFFALNISSLSLLSELGTVMGIGILMTLLAVFWVLPAMIHYKKEKDRNIRRIRGSFRFIGTVAHGVCRMRYIVLSILLLGAGFMGYHATKIGFDMNLMNLEPKGLASIELMDHMVEKYEMSSTSFALRVDSLDEVYRVTKALEAVDGVKEVAGIASILPEMEVQQDALDQLDEIKAMMEMKIPLQSVDPMMLGQIVSMLDDVLDDYQEAWQSSQLPILRPNDFDALRESINLLESELAGDVDEQLLNDLAESVYESMGDVETRMLSAQLITPSNLPDAYKAQFVSQDGTKFLLTIYTTFDIWQTLGTPKGDRLLSDLTAIAPSITGTPIFMMDLYNAVGDQLLMMGLILLGILLVILWVHFRSIRYTLLVFLPLAFTMVYTVGIMSLLNMPFNMINFLVVLLIIGIGLDDGVHILHHYKVGERNIRELFGKVGRAVFLTTVTTVFGFGSLSFSSYRGIAGLGIVLAIGVTLALVFTVLVLPIFLKDLKATGSGE